MPPITNDWQQPLAGEFRKPYYKELYQKVINEYNTRKSTKPLQNLQGFCKKLQK